MLPPGTVAGIDAAAWPLPPVFRWLARAGGVAADEMLRVFNCGLGMVLAVADPRGARVILEEAGETVFEIGQVEIGPMGTEAAQADAAAPPGTRIAVAGGWLE